jgi:hypothetical protein
MTLQLLARMESFCAATTASQTADLAAFLLFQGTKRVVNELHCCLGADQ